MDTSNHSDRLKRIFDLRRTANVHTRKQRIEEIYQVIPEYKQLDKSLPDIALAKVNALFKGDSNSSGDIKSEFSEIEEQKKALLIEHGYPENYLDPVYTCPDCKDTGYIGTDRCHCYKSELLNVIYESSGINSLTARHNFDNFNIEYYPDDYIESGSDITPRDNIKRILNICKEYIVNFNKTADNLLIYGHSGVGKTFLTHCIARELMNKSYSVIYLTSYQLFDILETKVFRADELDEINNGVLSMLYTCDLLIIDDLGTEMINKFTEVQLFTCIQERLLNKRSTIISTNLSFDDVKNNYSERIFSRIMGNYKLIKILGKDIRITKALMENGGKK